MYSYGWGEFRHIIHIHLLLLAAGGTSYVITSGGVGGAKVEKIGTRCAIDDAQLARYFTCDRGVTLRCSAVRFAVALFVISRKFERTQGVGNS